MSQFLQPARLALTPLSPIHIGLGEDFDPTTYVIDGGRLYLFDPARADLSPPLRNELLAVANHAAANMLGVYKFFYRNREIFKACAHTVVPVAKGIGENYLSSVSQASGQGIIDNNYIERAMFLPGQGRPYLPPSGQAAVTMKGMFLPGQGRPYLPGSSVKGALRTAWLEYLTGTKEKKDCKPQPKKPGKEVKFGEDLDVGKFEKTLLDGDFAESPLRLLKIGDFMPHEDIDEKIVFALNLKKKLVFVNGKEAVEGSGPITRKEAVLSGQYRAFVSESATFDPNRPPAKGVPGLRPLLTDLAEYCNKYFWKRMKAENAVLRERGYVPADWLNRLEELVKKQIDKGGAFLIRLGRYNSAEDKTLENFAKITIKGQKGAPTTVKEASTTLWLAADAKKQTSGMTPFGWALAEIDPQGENESLKAWCQQERQGRPDMEPLRKQLREQQEQRAAEKAARVEQEHLAEVKAEEEAAMTEEQRQLADLCAKLTQHPLFKGRDVGDTLLKECENILTAAAAWPPEDKRALLERLPPLLAEKECYQGRYEKIFKKLLKALS